MTSKVIQLTDTHLFSTRDQTQKGVNTYDSLQAVVEHVAAKHPDLDALLLTGDLSQDETAQSYETLKRILAPILTVPTHAIPGNHDDLGLMQDRLPGDGITVLGDAHLGNWRFAMLNSQVPGRVHGELGQDQIDRFDASLQAHPTHTIAVMHHPPVKVDSAWIDASRCYDGDELLHVATAPPVAAVLCGHIHQEFSATHNGVAILATPSTCVQFRPREDEFAVDDTDPGYRILELEEDGRWSTSVQRVKTS